MSAKSLLEKALEQCSADEANGVQLFPAYNRLKRACEMALEGLSTEPVKPLVRMEAPREGSAVEYGPEIVVPVCNAVAHITGVTVEGMKSVQRTQNIVNARHAFYWIVRKRTAMRLVDIAAVLGHDHASVNHAINKVEEDKIIGGERWRIVRAVESKLWPEVSDETR